MEFDLPIRSTAARIAGATLAFYILVGRWSIERLSGIESARYFTLNAGMLLEPRNYVLPILLVTVLFIPIRRSAWDDETSGFNVFFVRLSVGWFTLLCTWLIASLGWTPSFENALLKGYEILTMLLVCWCVYLWMSSSAAAGFRDAFWSATFALTGFLALMAIASLTQGRLSALGGGPNMFARMMALLAIYCLSANRQLFSFRYVCAAVAMGLLVLSGSRGGMLAAAVGLAGLLFFDQTRVTRKVQIVGVLGISFLLLMGLTPLGTRVYEAFSQRIVQATLEDRYMSDRDILLEEAVALWRERPVTGVGIGGWEVYSGDLGSYPHNLFAEVLCEGGGVAFVLTALCLVMLGIHAVRNRQHLHAASLAACMTCFVSSQFSGDFFDSRGVFTVMCLTAVPTAWPTQWPDSSAEDRLADPTLANPACAMGGSI